MLVLAGRCHSLNQAQSRRYSASVHIQKNRVLGKQGRRLSSAATCDAVLKYHGVEHKCTGIPATPCHSYKTIGKRYETLNSRLVQLTSMWTRQEVGHALV